MTHDRRAPFYLRDICTSIMCVCIIHEQSVPQIASIPSANTDYMRMARSSIEAQHPAAIGQVQDEALWKWLEQDAPSVSLSLLHPSTCIRSMQPMGTKHTQHVLHIHVWCLECTLEFLRVHISLCIAYLFTQQNIYMKICRKTRARAG
jgi:hypothetical protein